MGFGGSSEDGALQFDGWRLTGYIDRMDVVLDGEAVIFDYKSGNSGVLALKELIEGGKLQLQLYMLAARRSLGLSPVGSFYLPVCPGAGRPRGIGLGREPKPGRKTLRAPAGLECLKLYPNDLRYNADLEQLLADAENEANSTVGRIDAGDIAHDPGQCRSHLSIAVCRSRTPGSAREAGDTKTERLTAQQLAAIECRERDNPRRGGSANGQGRNDRALPAPARGAGAGRARSCFDLHLQGLRPERGTGPRRPRKPARGPDGRRLDRNVPLDGPRILRAHPVAADVVALDVLDDVRRRIRNAAFERALREVSEDLAVRRSCHASGWDHGRPAWPGPTISCVPAARNGPRSHRRRAWRATSRTPFRSSAGTSSIACSPRTETLTQHMKRAEALLDDEDRSLRR